MGRFVNPDNSAFQVALNSPIYVDKTGLLEYTNSVLNTTEAYICNSRPRRFGKSYAANIEAIFGECKWRNEPADVDILETLQERSGLFHYQKQSYMIFSKSGFTEKLKLREKEEENVRLISFEDMNQL